MSRRTRAVRVGDLAIQPFDHRAMARFVELAPMVTFGTAWQGYDRDQVDSFRADLEAELRASWAQAARRHRAGIPLAAPPPGGVRLGGSNVRDMRFGKALRGYDPNEVDVYLDCAGAVLSYLHAR
jgi:DivIVA domain-containing protein